MMGNDTYAIVDVTSGGKVIGQVDSISAPELVYPNAVYLHEGRSYVVRQMDIEGKVAAVEPCEVDYYTQPVLSSSCRLGDPTDRKDHLDGEAFFGAADVTWQTIAFRKVKYYTMELIGQSRLDLPSQTLTTTAAWWAIGQGALEQIERGGYKPVEALCGMRNLMLASLPSLAMCDRRDISGMVDSSNLGRPVIVIYDRYFGGLGFSQQGYELLGRWTQMCARIVRECACEGGCPSCVGLANLRPAIHSDPDLFGGMPVPNKAATLLLLGLLERDADREGEKIAKPQAADRARSAGGAGVGSER